MCRLITPCCLQVISGNLYCAPTRNRDGGKAAEQDLIITVIKSLIKEHNIQSLNQPREYEAILLAVNESNGEVFPVTFENSMKYISLIMEYS